MRIYLDALTIFMAYEFAMFLLGQKFVTLSLKVGKFDDKPENLARAGVTLVSLVPILNLLFIPGILSRYILDRRSR